LANKLVHSNKKFCIRQTIRGGVLTHKRLSSR